MRRYEISSLRDNGDIRQSQHIAPADPLFEEAFSAMARGTVIETTTGRRAVEDLLPGDVVVTTSQGPQPVLWIGSMAIVPNAPVANKEHSRLIRVLADSYGGEGTLSDFLGGPAARIVKSSASFRQNMAHTKMLVPLHDLTDGVNIFEVSPPSTVAVFHICLAQHATFMASGLEIESFHPGYDRFDGLDRNLHALFLTLFPHVESMADFGALALPRVSSSALDSLTAA